jgi:excinuclease ABC subunit C
MHIRTYKRNIRAIKDILSGKRDTVIRSMERRMRMLGSAHRLEEAYALQQTIERMRRVFQNAQINAERTRMAARHPGALSQAQELFGLIDEPKRIEGYDVANMQGEHGTGAMVVFEDGKANNQEYRVFNIQTRGGGDTAMLTETLDRRLNHPEWPFPNLIVVDGSKAQLNAVVKTLARRGKSIPVVALTKNDRHQADHIHSSSNSNVHYLCDLPRPIRDLLIHIDSEAHRFSIAHYRRRHRRILAPAVER